MITPSPVLLPLLRSRTRGAACTWVALCLSAGLALYSLPAHAARAVDEVAQLLEQGKAEQAAKQADSFLQQNPGDVEMRFLRGVIATEQKQSAQAIRIFSALTRDYPQMPEPYNNLAVLYAADGQERKAAEALEQAIRTNPSYSTAHENLGDLYARMASEAYSKALQLDGSRQEIRPKLALITQIVPGGSIRGKAADGAAGPAQPAPAVTVASAAAVGQAQAEVMAASVSAPPAVTTRKAPEPAAAVAPAAMPTPATPTSVTPTPATTTPAATKPAKTEPVQSGTLQSGAVQSVASTKPVADPAAKGAASPSKPVADAVAKPVPATPSASAEVERAVQAWASAWEKKDMAGYLDAYSDQFQPAGGGSLAAWKQGRHVRIVGKQDISVRLHQLRVTVNGTEASASFRQHYVAGALNTTTRKTLQLRQEKGRWRIVRESTGG